MPWPFIVAAAVAVLVIALVAVGREALTLGVLPKQALFDLDEAVDYVADRLPVPVAARLSYDDVRRLLGWHIEYLRDQGVPRTRETAARGDAIPVVIDEDEPVAYLLMRAEAAGLDADADDVVAVLDAEAAYFTAIGAIGPEAEADGPGR
jgi:hypothetical protein